MRALSTIVTRGAGMGAAGMGDAVAWAPPTGSTWLAAAVGAGTAGGGASLRAPRASLGAGTDVWGGLGRSKACVGDNCVVDAVGVMGPSPSPSRDCGGCGWWTAW